MNVRSEIPIVQLARELRPASRSLGAVVLTAALVVYGFIALLTPLVPALQARLIAATHYRPASLLTWILLQPAPKMYGFANQVWIGPEPSARQIDARAFWVNHYPARMARFDGERAQVFADPEATTQVFVRTRYRGHTFFTAVRVERTAEGLRWLFDPQWEPRP